ncbi:TPA: hypothetical protein ACHW7I_000741 [Legionella pneumophila]|uniref:hypothetical protein n=1 Tax=Legionella pneumophila TaxID=446 RepID=UPI0007707C09|nr:hypothetical protein [Legionella pneumophila]HCC3244921.1 hypothetical protein [Legionella pneumophila subsp. pneumophila]MCZ4805134.1 hypothetical protein [Legionella pneumophila]MDW8854656.1 hypothetical protein [Legionella pneumophila]MDW8921988.1 hypothetical protein [Legionella pneumophila]MDW8928235.1 hypothetical protein [Legionella pneumophila]
MAVPHEIKEWPDIKNSSVLPIASLSEAISEFILIKISPILLIRLKQFRDLHVEIFYSG